MFCFYCQLDCKVHDCSVLSFVFRTAKSARSLNMSLCYACMLDVSVAGNLSHIATPPEHQALTSLNPLPCLTQFSDSHVWQLMGTGCKQGLASQNCTFWFCNTCHALRFDGWLCMLVL